LIPRGVGGLVVVLAVLAACTTEPAPEPRPSETSKAATLPPAENGRLAFLSNREGDSDQYGVYVTDPRGARVTRLADVTVGWEEQLAWSPDGAWLAFSARADYRGATLLITDAAGSDLREVTRLEAWGVAWAPDGQRLAFMAAPRPRAGPRLYVYDVASHDTQVILQEGLAEYAAPAWSPDGSSLAFVQQTSARRSRPAVVQVVGGSVQALASAGSGAPSQVAWSPDGSVVSFLAGPLEQRTLYLRGGDQNATIDARVLDYEWFRDGKRIALHTMRGLEVIEISSLARDLLHRIDDSADASFSVAPDGTAVALAVDGDLRVIDLAGTEVSQVAPGVFDDRRVAWQPVAPGTDPLALRRRPARSAVPAGALADACQAGHVRGDFDGDDRPDVAVVYTPLLPSKDCSFRPARRIAVFFGSGRSFTHRLGCSLWEFRDWRIPEGCSAGATPDFNGDGRDELLLNVGGGSAHGDVHAAYAVLRRGLRRIDIAPSGSSRVQAGPAEFALVGGASIPSHLYCRREDGRRVVVRYSGSTDLRSRPRLHVVEDVFVFDGSALHFVKTRRYVTPYDQRPSSPTFCGDRSFSI
jgi:dipeptidyl aminopeptidase/acylaminoacyl peptidase